MAITKNKPENRYDFPENVEKYRVFEAVSFRGATKRSSEWVKQQGDILYDSIHGYFIGYGGKTEIGF